MKSDRQCTGLVEVLRNRIRCGHLAELGDWYCRDCLARGRRSTAGALVRLDYETEAGRRCGNCGLFLAFTDHPDAWGSCGAAPAVESTAAGAACRWWRPEPLDGEVR